MTLSNENSIDPADLVRLLGLAPADAERTAYKALAGVLTDSLYEFVRATWPTMESTPFQDSWHVSATCEHVQAWFEGQLERPHLVIHKPRRFTKSTIVSKAFPAWAWAVRPALGLGFYHASDKLASRDNNATKRIITSPLYQILFGDRFQILETRSATNSRSKVEERRFRAQSLEDRRRAGYQDRVHLRSREHRIENDKGGVRIAAPILSRTIGEGHHFGVLDDPNDIRLIHSLAHQNAVNNAWDLVVSGNENDPGRTRWLLDMQRGAGNDLAGHLLRTAPELWEYFRIPQEFEPDRRFFTSIGWTDPREKAGELIDEARVPRWKVDVEKRNRAKFAAQHQGLPVDPQGSAVKKRSLRFWKSGLARPYWDWDLGRILHGSVSPVPALVIPAPSRWVRKMTSWDLGASEPDAGKVVSGAAWTVGWAFGFSDEEGRLAHKYVLDEERVQDLFPRENVKALHARHPSARPTLIESKYTGAAIVKEVRDLIPGVKPFDPSRWGSKLNRLMSILDEFLSGCVVFPHPDECRADPVTGLPWVLDAVEELCKLPEGKFWDRMDVVVQALLHLSEAPAGFGALVGRPGQAGAGVAGFGIGGAVGASDADEDWAKRRAAAEASEFWERIAAGDSGSRGKEEGGEEGVAAASKVEPESASPSGTAPAPSSSTDEVDLAFEQGPFAIVSAAASVGSGLRGRGGRDVRERIKGRLRARR